MSNFFRILSFVEGLSLLALLFVAMPVKYMGGDPTLVKLVGPIHGFLFLAFVGMCFSIATHENWSKRLTVFALISSSIPFGMLMLERKLKKLEVDATGDL